MENKPGGKGEVALNPVSVARSAFDTLLLRYMPSGNESRNQLVYENEVVRTYLSVYPLTDARAVTLSHNILLQYALN